MSAPPTMAAICKVVTEHCKVTKGELESKRRDAGVVRCRHIIAYLTFKLNKSRSSTQIGWVIGRDHSTVLYGRDKIAADILNDPDLAREIADLEKQILEGATHEMV